MASSSSRRFHLFDMVAGVIVCALFAAMLVASTRHVNGGVFVHLIVGVCIFWRSPFPRAWPEL